MLTNWFLYFIYMQLDVYHGFILSACNSGKSSQKGMKALRKNNYYQDIIFSA